MELGKEPGVQGLVQLGRNAIERVAQLESENSYLRAANSDGAALLQKLRDRIAALEAEKAEREQNGINSQWLTGVIRRADPKMSLTSDELAEKILDAINGRLTLREPTDEECSRIYAIADMNPITHGSEIGEMPARTGRAMWQAVREVMTK